MLHHNCKSNSPVLITNSESLEWTSPTSCMHVHGLLTTFPGHWSIQEFPVPLVSDILVCVPAIITYYECNNHSMSLLPCHWTTQSTKTSTLELPVIGINTIFGNPSTAVLHHEPQSNTSSHTMATGYWSEPHTDKQSVCMLCMWVPNVCTECLYTYYKSRICQIAQINATLALNVRGNKWNWSFQTNNEENYSKGERRIRNKDPNNRKEAHTNRGRGRWLTRGDEQQRSIQNSRGSGKAVQEVLEAEERIIRGRQQWGPRNHQSIQFTDQEEGTKSKIHVWWGWTLEQRLAKD